MRTSTSSNGAVVVCMSILTSTLLGLEMIVIPSAELRSVMSWRLSPKAMSMSPFSSWTRLVPTLSMIGISMRDTSAGSVPAKSGLATSTIAWPGSADSTLNRPPPTGVVLIHSCAHSSSAGAFS